MTFEEQLSTVGHARVMVVLKPNKRRKIDGAMRIALDETIDLQQQAATEVSKHFKRFANSRAAMLSKDLEQMLKARHEVRASIRDKRAYAAVRPSERVRYYPHLGVMLGTVDRAGLAALHSEAKTVKSVLAPPELSLIQPVEDAALAGPLPGISWGLQRMQIPDLWDEGLRGDGVLIGHLDTGVDVTHPALTNAVDAFAEFDFLGDQMANSTVRDTRYHGTHTAGLLVGQPYNGVTFGVAPEAKLCSAIVIEGGDIPARVIGGLNWCVGQGVRVVNVSLGVRGFDDQFSSILSLLRQRNILPVVAIGNEGAQTSRSPGNLKESLSIGAMDEADQIWLGSSSQVMTSPKRNVPVAIAPGAGIYSCVPGPDLRSLTGTSMATPHVAGLAALLIQHRPDVPIAKIEAAILSSCQRPLSISTLRGNKGVPNAVEALKAL